MEKFFPGRPYRTAFNLPGGAGWGVTFYGDAAAEGAEWLAMAATAEHPRHACLESHQMVAYWERFAEPLPTAEARERFDAAAKRFGAKRWRRAKEVEGLPDTGSSLDHGERGDTPLAEGFELLSEKPRRKPLFSEKEVLDLLRLAAGLDQSRPSRDYLGSGERVFIPPHAWMGFPAPLQEILGDALAQVYSLGRDQIRAEARFSKSVGYTDCVPFGKWDVAYYARLGGHYWWTPVVRGRKPRRTWRVSVVLSRNQREGSYTLRTAYFGPLSPPLPGNTGGHRRTGDEAASRLAAWDFWTQHALRLEPFAGEVAEFELYPGGKVPPEFRKPRRRAKK